MISKKFSKNNKKKSKKGGAVSSHASSIVVNNVNKTKILKKFDMNQNFLNDRSICNKFVVKTFRQGVQYETYVQQELRKLLLTHNHIFKIPEAFDINEGEGNNFSVSMQRVYPIENFPIENFYLFPCDLF